MSLLLGEKEYCLELVTYLRESINLKYAAEVECNPHLPKQYVVNGIRNFDDPSIPLSEFPVLKVYRNSDLYDGITPFSMTSATLTYSVAYPDLAELPDLLYWMSYAIKESLVEFSYDRNEAFDMKQMNKLQMQYLLTYNDVINAIHPFLRTNLQFKDNRAICFKNKNCPVL